MHSTKAYSFAKDNNIVQDEEISNGTSNKLYVVQLNVIFSIKYMIYTIDSLNNFIKIST